MRKPFVKRLYRITATFAEGTGLPAGCAAGVVVSLRTGHVLRLGRIAAGGDVVPEEPRPKRERASGQAAGQEVSKGTSSVRWPKAIAL